MQKSRQKQPENLNELEDWRRAGELITQQRIAELAGVSVRTAHLWCTGKTRPSIGQIRTLEAFRPGLVERYFPGCFSEQEGDGETNEGDACVYFIQQGAEGPIKIGKSRDPDARLRQLQQASPQQLHLLAVSRVLDEDEIQRRFAHSAIRNEWFFPHAELVAFIQALQKDAG